MALVLLISNQTLNLIIGVPNSPENLPNQVFFLTISIMRRVSFSKYYDAPLMIYGYM